MYPNLTPSLVTLLGVAFAASAFIALRRPVLRRLALRQVARRPREAALVILGSMLGTAIVVGSLIVGDTLNYSVKQGAYDNLGPIDETVMSTGLAEGRLVAAALEPLRRDPSVDGVLTAHGDLAAVTIGTGPSRSAEPRVGIWDLDFGQAAAFGAAAGDGSGLAGPAPGPGQVVINEKLADAVQARAGDTLTFYLYGSPVAVRVARVIPTRGLGGMPNQGVTQNAFFAPGTLPRAQQAAAAAGSGAADRTAEPHTFTFVSNAGGVEEGSSLTGPVAHRIVEALGPLRGRGYVLETSKERVLDEAKQAGDSLGSMFLMIGSFAIMAGILLLIIIFVMLSEERKPELGMLRAIGMKRSRLVRSFIIEGTVYALLASLLGVIVGLGVGRAVVIVAARIFSGYDAEGTALHLMFHVTPISVINGFALGLLIALATVTLTSMRISRINIIAAIRDLPPDGGRRMKRRWVVASSLVAAGFAALSAQAIAANQGVGTYLFPALASGFAAPALLLVVPKRWVYSGLAFAVLVWSLVASSVRPHLLDDVGPAAFVILGLMLTVSAVVLVSENQNVVARPLRPLIERTSEIGLATRLGLAYPLGKRFRTGSILIMYGLVVFTLVFITVLSALVDATVNRQVTSATGGYSVRADFNPATPVWTPASAFTLGPFTRKVHGVAPLLVGRGQVTHLSPTLDAPVDAVVVGADARIVQEGLFRLTERMAGYGDDRKAWNAILSNPRLVIVDNFLGQLNAGGPPKTLFHAGDTLTLTDPRSGISEQKRIVGILDSAYAFYGMGGGVFSPVLMSSGAAADQFGPSVQVSSALVKPEPGVSDQWLATKLQGQFLKQGVVATRIREVVERNFTANRGFFQLMQGFIALGLLVGIAGLGVMMVRAVRERRRSIGVLRALGFQARMVQRAFLTESLFVTGEGVLIGAGLSVLTAYLLFKNYAMFETGGGGFAVPWLAIAILVALATGASVLATMWPARQASRIDPAVAIRVAD
jgi:putative ABC transport system permease protein